MSTVTTVRLPRASFYYENIQACIGALIVMGLGWSLGYTQIPGPWGLRLAVTLTIAVPCFLAFDVFLNLRQIRFFWLTVTGSGCEFHRGRYMTTRTVIVPGSILSVDVARGPLLRKLGLARIKFNGIAQFPDIPAMDEADAVAIQRLLTRERLNSDFPKEEVTPQWNP